MPDVDPSDRIAQLTKARDAAQAVIDEINRRNIADPFPPRIDQRKPKMLMAQGDVSDLDDIIDDEEAAALVVSIDPADVATLQTLAAKLDKAITGTALQATGLSTITSVLTAVASIRDTLSA